MTQEKPTRYRNSFHQPRDTTYGPEFYETYARPIEHRGFLIFQRLPQCFDIVENGVCVGQLAGLNGAKSAIENGTYHTVNGRVA